MPRTLFIGDVHGCLEEYDALVAQFAPAPDDCIAHVGDLIARGPDSIGVIRSARARGAVVVRGNHEERLLRWRKTPDEIKMHPTHLEVARALSNEEWDWLDATPLWRDFPAHGVRVLHAGVEPSISDFSFQNSHTLMNIRTTGQPPELWAKSYAAEPHIIFGHHAAAGLQLHAHATGLDTGCVYGGALTGLVLNDGESPAPPARRAQQLLHEKAKRVYVQVRSYRP